MNSGRANVRTLRGRDVLGLLLSFFITVCAVDVYMITKAVGTFSGDTDDAYRKGLAYNQTLKEEAIQNELGWTERRGFDSRTGRLTVNFEDRQKNTIDGLTVRAEIGRAATDIFDRKLILKSVGDGTYVADIASLGEGSWTLSIDASDHDVVVYKSKARLWKQP